MPVSMDTVSKVPGVSARRTAVQLAALSALGPFCIDAYLPSMPDISRVMNQSLDDVQGTLTAYMIPFAVMTLWHGALSDTFGRRRMVVLGLAAFAVASAGCALASSLPWLIFFRVFQGATAGVGMVVGRAIVRDLYDGPEAQKLMAMVAIVFAIAPAIAPIVGGWLQAWFGWRAIFVFMAVYASVLLATIAATLPETLPRSDRQSFRPGFLAKSYLTALRHPVFMTACVAIAFAFAGLFLYVLSAPEFLMHHLHVSATGFLWLFGPLTAGIVVGNVLCARLAGRLSLVRTAAIGCAVMLVCALANVGMNLLMPPRLPWAVIPLFGYMVGMSLVLPTLTIRAIDCFPQQRGLAASCQSFVQSAGSSVLSAAAPLLWISSLSLSASQFAFGLVSAGMLALVPLLSRRGPA